MRGRELKNKYMEGGVLKEERGTAVIFSKIKITYLKKKSTNFF